MKLYLIETFKFNDRSNRTILGKIKEMEDPTEAIKLFSHLIYSQNKWMARITKDPNESKIEWFGKSFVIDELDYEWEKSIRAWLNYLENISEDELMTEVRFVSSEGKKLGAKIKDVALQLNYHSIHHRAQICILLRKQDIEVPFIEYIGTVLNRY